MEYQIYIRQVYSYYSDDKFEVKQMIFLLKSEGIKKEYKNSKLKFNYFNFISGE